MTVVDWREQRIDVLEAKVAALQTALAKALESERQQRARADAAEADARAAWRFGWPRRSE